MAPQPHSKAIMHRLPLQRGFSMIEVMIATLLLATFGAMVVQGIVGILAWSALGRAKDEINTDMMRIWNTLNDDISQSAWYRPNTGTNFNVSSLAEDRALFYAPYIVQAAHGTGLNGGEPTPTNTLLRPFARANAGNIIFNPLPTSLLAKNEAPLPGEYLQRGLKPGDPEYNISFFGRSQELVFVRATNSLWNDQAQRPVVAGDGRPVNSTMDRFGGDAADWKSPSKHSTLNVLQPSGWQQSGTAFTELTPGVPYGRVMESSIVSNASGNLTFSMQLEQYGQPTYQTQAATDVRLYGYLVVPCPRDEGLGRLVRVRTDRSGSALGFGSDVGQMVAQEGAVQLVVDKVLSDNVVRVIFETARHACDATAAPTDRSEIGINNIRATIFLARSADQSKDSAPIVTQIIRMVFCMRASNSVSEQFASRTAMTRLPFRY
jgi:prepilin-type N-terminal cleavage/methylation domain-containing protein